MKVDKINGKSEHGDGRGSYVCYLMVSKKHLSISIMTPFANNANVSLKFSL